MQTMLYLRVKLRFLPLNILPPDTSLPLAVFFPPDIPFDAKPQVQILTAIRLLPNDERYMPATINNTLVQVNADGHSAQVSGLVLSQSQTSAANQVWVTATAYDEAGRVVGVRRWESNASLPAGGSLPFDFMVSSIGGKIARVEFAVEADHNLHRGTSPNFDELCRILGRLWAERIYFPSSHIYRSIGISIGVKT